MDTLFDLGVELVPKHTPAADASRSLEQRCWTDCGHCGMTDYHQYHKNHSMRIYKLCHVRRDVPEPVFIFSRACERFLDSHRFSKPAPAQKPRGRGWEDF